jgi:soluble lytic murein transglycosylase-like protein
VIWQESRFRADAVGPVTRSGKRALGIAQVHAGDGRRSGISEPARSDSGAAEIRRVPPGICAASFGNLGLRRRGLQRRSASRSRVAAGTGPMPAETRAYVQAITGASVEQWAKATVETDSNTGMTCGR